MHRRLPLILLAVSVLAVVAWRGWPPGGKGSQTNSVPSRASEGARNIQQSEARLRKRLETRLADTVGAHIDAMLGFYREDRFVVEGADGGGDGLLVQWGTYDWGQGSHFELDMTRQFFIANEDEPFQLSLTMRFKPTAALSALGSSNRWCFSLRELGEFEAFIRSSPPYEMLALLEPDEIEILFEQV